ncbi:uncharacterized protein LOC142056676 isoform X2 [Phalacrocorax aristotelis]|uniref:uncharacterized protein LOC142056676 isoform X2 n=1 Tax=Phalacrocorax aristotelis TaxID=126867 RepID=UPI003F4C6F64
MIIILLRLLLTMCFGTLATDPNNIRVIQNPAKIDLSVGDRAEIACVWEKSVVRYRISWYLVNKENITKTVSSELFYVSNITRQSMDVLVIKSASRNDTGFYYCEIIIEIPFCKKVCGNGTTVTVEEKGALLKKKDLSIWAIIPFLMSVVGSLYLCFCPCRKKQHSELSGRHQEEQKLEVAELHERNESTYEANEENSSCNSAEWAVSTLYESLDVFCNESKGKDDKSTATVVSSAADEQIPQN